MKMKWLAWLLAAVIGGLIPGIATWGGTPPQLNSIAVRPTQSLPLTGDGYSTNRFVVGSSVESRLYFNGHHFLTILTDNGTFNLRPHPGVDPNGWGSSWYLQPFLPGSVLQGTSLQDITVTASDIMVTAAGIVSQGTNSSYGTWILSLSLSYDPALKQVQGTGGYSITLSGALSDSTGDLNLCRIASNYLDEVPLLDGTIGDTGDMSVAAVSGQGLTPFNWCPPLQPSQFPNNPTDSLAIEVVGDYYQLDATAQSYCAIQAAYKPTLTVVFASRTNNIPMIFGGIYDTASATAFFADNVGITPLVLKTSALTQYTFDVTFTSAALAGDGPEWDADLTATYAVGGPTLAVHFSEALENPFKQLVGYLNQTGADAYAGTVSVPYPQTASHFPSTGFFIVRTPCN